LSMMVSLDRALWVSYRHTINLQS